MGSRGAKATKINWGQIANIPYHTKLSTDRIRRKPRVFVFFLKHLNYIIKSLFWKNKANGCVGGELRGCSECAGEVVRTAARARMQEFSRNFSFFFK